MAWKPIGQQQWVLARLDGKVREVLVTAWESYSGAVTVAWPPDNQVAAARYPYSRKAKRTEIAKTGYEPLDPDAFKLATEG